MERLYKNIYHHCHLALCFFIPFHLCLHASEGWVYLLPGIKSIVQPWVWWSELLSHQQKLPCCHQYFSKRAYKYEAFVLPITTHRQTCGCPALLPPKTCESILGRNSGGLLQAASCSTERIPPWPTFTCASHTSTHTHTHTQPIVDIPEYEAGFQQQTSQLCIQLVINLEKLLWSVLYTEENQWMRVVPSCFPCFQECKPVTASPLPMKGKKWASYMESWALLILKVMLLEKRWKAMWIPLFSTEMNSVAACITISKSIVFQW